MNKTNEDEELAAIRSVLDALLPLDPEARARVVDYAFRRLGIDAGTAPTLMRESSEAGPETPPPAAQDDALVDIRSLSNMKQPSSAIEMATIVAYYLKEAVPDSERRSEIDAADLEKYFKQASFRLPKAIGQTLLNAKNAGYLDPGAERGRFKINPVGYNLVVHGLPKTRTGSSEKPKKRPQRRTTKKRTTKQKTSTKKTRRRS